MDLVDTGRACYPKEVEYIFFSCVHGTFSRIDNMLNHKANSSKFKKIEIISSILSHHNTVSLERDYKKKRNCNKHKPLQAKYNAAAAAAAAKLLQSCPTLCNPIDGSPPGSPVPGILQGRTLEWVTKQQMDH